MDRAIVGVCYSSRQRRILDVTLPSWRRYAEKHGLPIHIIERSYAGENFYWAKHLLYRAPELSSYKSLLFLDNDVFVNENSAALLNNWDSPLIGATFESTQAGWSSEFISKYYRDYAVDCSAGIPNPGVINTGVLIIPHDQAGFMEGVYEAWRKRMKELSGSFSLRQAPFVLEADQPHVSYALQAAGRFADFGESFNRLWWHWYDKNVSPRRLPFLVRSKAAALTVNVIPRRLWRTIFAKERALFAAAKKQCQFLHVAGSKSAVYLGA